MNDEDLQRIVQLVKSKDPSLVILLEKIKRKLDIIH